MGWGEGRGRAGTPPEGGVPACSPGAAIVSRPKAENDAQGPKLQQGKLMQVDKLSTKRQRLITPARKTTRAKKAAKISAHTALRREPE